MNSRPVAHNRAELYAHADAYLAALAAKDLSRLKLADRVVFTENNVQLRLGDGLWNSVSAVRGSYDLKCADLSQGEVCWFGIVEEHGVPSVMSLRLKIVGGLIAEIETVVCRKVDFSPFPSVETYIAPRPLMLADVPAKQRRPRARMIAIADGYFDTLQLNDGQLFSEFTDDCDRVENGLQTTNTQIEGYPIAAMGCAEQFRLGQYVYDDRLRDRRFPLIDEEKGLVLAAGFIDHSAKVVDITWTDGKTKVRSPFFYPHSYALLELFKITDGKLAGVEAVFVTVPYNMPSPWTAYRPVDAA
ncbi:MAG: hypothetical protein ABIO26_09950 [Croceibacterium sp.]